MKLKTINKINSIEDLKPDDIVKSCPYVEHGVYFAIDGVHCCVNGTFYSPIIASNDELNNKTIDYNTIIQRRKDIFTGINGITTNDVGCCKNCCNLVEKKFRDVRFDILGGEHLPGGMGIQHYTMCNYRCTYCCYAIENKFDKPQYNILDFLNIYKAKNKLKGNNWIDFSGGEPAMLNNIDEILQYFYKNNLGTVVIYSNASIYSKKIFELLKKNKIILTTSLDTGMFSTYQKLRGTNAFPKTIENLIKYRNSGTNNLWLKYVITESNRTEDDLWSFLLAMLAIKPNKVMISPDFPYGDKEIPQETVKFAAKLWYLLEKYLGVDVIDYTSSMGDIKFRNYQKALFNEINSMKTKAPLSKETILSYPPISPKIAERFKFIKEIFSVNNENNHKVIKILGIKLKFKISN